MRLSQRDVGRVICKGRIELGSIHQLGVQKIIASRCISKHLLDTGRLVEDGNATLANFNQLLTQQMQIYVPSSATVLHSKVFGRAS